jgi:hypothetical protein
MHDATPLRLNSAIGAIKVSSLIYYGTACLFSCQYAQAPAIAAPSPQGGQLWSSANKKALPAIVITGRAGQ